MLVVSVEAQKDTTDTTTATEVIIPQEETSTEEQDTSVVVVQPKVTADTTQASSSSNGDGNNLSEIRQLISLKKIIWTILLLIASYWFNRLVARILNTISERFTNYRLFIKRLVPIIRVSIWIFIIYIIIEGVLNPPFQTIVTLMASVGLAVGFASQDTLKNIFGGFMIILDRPFQIGDKIEVGDYYGEVLQIGLRSTRVVTPDDSIVSIPNSELVTRSVSNANSGALYCQVVAEIYLPAELDIPTVKDLAYKAALSSKYVYLEKPIVIIALNEMHEEQFVLKFRVKAYVLDIRYEFPFKSDMTELVLESLNERDLIPGPVSSPRI
ncbi:MAG: mechanosensitive ion channel family protein [Bacteroidota bacterium]